MATPGLAGAVAARAARALLVIDEGDVTDRTGLSV